MALKKRFTLPITKLMLAITLIGQPILHCSQEQECPEQTNQATCAQEDNVDQDNSITRYEKITNNLKNKYQAHKEKILICGAITAFIATMGLSYKFGIRCQTTTQTNPSQSQTSLLEEIRQLRARVETINQDLQGLKQQLNQEAQEKKQELFEADQLMQGLKDKLSQTIQNNNAILNQ